MEMYSYHVVEDTRLLQYSPQNGQKKNTLTTKALKFTETEHDCPWKRKKLTQRVQKYKKRHAIGEKKITPRSKENGQEVTRKGSRNNQKMYKTIAGNYVWKSQKQNTTS